MRKNAFVAMDHIAALNEFRKHSIQSGLLVRVEGDMWTWKNQLPIHHQTLQGIYVRYQKKANGYASAHYARKKREEVLKSKEIEEAVNLLKSNGFEVFAPYKGLYKKL